MRKWLIIAGMFFVPWPAVADETPLQISLTLGDLVGSEQICDIRIDQMRLSAYISEHIPASDMSFSRTMSTAVDVMPRTFKRMTPSMQTAHCLQMRRLADSLGLTAK